MSSAFAYSRCPTAPARLPGVPSRFLRKTTKLKQPLMHGIAYTSVQKKPGLLDVTLCSSNGNLAEAPEEERALAAHRRAVISRLMDSLLSRDKVKVDMAEHFLLSLQESIPPCAISVVTESVAYQAAHKLNRPPGPAFSAL